MFSSGQLQRQQERNKLHSIRIFGECGSATKEAMDAELHGLRAVVARYEPKDVFDIDGANCEPEG